MCVPITDCLLCTRTGSQCDKAHHADTPSKQEQQPWNTATEETLRLIQGGEGGREKQKKGHCKLMSSETVLWPTMLAHISSQNLEMGGFD